MTQQLRLATIEPEQQRATGPRPRVALPVVLGGHLAVVAEPSLVLRRSAFHPAPELIERQQLVAVLLRQANVPDIVMPEMEQNRVRPRADDDAHAAVPEHAAIEE